MLEKFLDAYLTNQKPYKDTLMTYDVDGDGDGEVESEIDALHNNEKLEKKILGLFGILLQLIVFYLPLINICFRGKTIPGIIS